MKKLFPDTSKKERVRLYNEHRKQYRAKWRKENWDKVKEHWRKSALKKKLVITIYLPEKTDVGIVYKVGEEIKGKRELKKKLEF